mgnify:CR=1 FL=1
MEKENVIEGLAALAQETRLDIVRFLVRRGADGAAAGEIGEQLGVPAATLTFHLNILKGAGLLVRRRVSRNIIYRADFALLQRMMGYLLDNCCAEENCAPAESEGTRALRRRVAN